MTLAEQLKEKGRQEGLERGMEKGIERGEMERSKKTAVKMLERGYVVEDIVEISGLSKEQIRDLAKNL